MSNVARVVQVGEVREMEVKAARLEGASDARQLVEQERSQLLRQHEEQLQQLKAQEYQVGCFVQSLYVEPAAWNKCKPGRKINDCADRLLNSCCDGVDLCVQS